ncbi:MAG: hypothetical protein RUMPE_00946 [Eubacteriales bacterium SKADARSKE-1]|nr:hypothetical protein [Eubacteriales bacterium SKADARSKE-1]
MEIEFHVPGPPQGKARPRLCQIRGRNIVYTPIQTVKYEKLIKECYQAVTDFKFPKGEPVYIIMVARFPVPKSTSKKEKEKMLSREIFPAKKPDVDNIAKAVLDALNGVAFHDDAQVCAVGCQKIYSEFPGINVSVYDKQGYCEYTDSI